MKPLPPKKIIKILTANGFVLSRQKGSHIVFRSPATGLMTIVPLHSGNKPLPLGTFLAIVKQSKIPKDQFK